MFSARFEMTVTFIAALTAGVDILYGQNFPSRPIRIVTSGAGGGSDFDARIAGLEVVVSSVQLGSTPGSVRLPPPEMGEHSAEILRDMGIGSDAIDALVSTGVIAGLA